MITHRYDKPIHISIIFHLHLTNTYFISSYAIHYIHVTVSNFYAVYLFNTTKQNTQ